MRTQRRTWIHVHVLRFFFVLTLIFSLTAVSVPASAQPSNSKIPSSVSSIKNSDQVVYVTAKAWNSTAGLLETYERKKGKWQLVQRAVKANLGYGGLVPGNKRKQGTGKTPTGTYAITTAFGRKADPGTRLNYTKVDQNDAWTYNPRYPSTYNLFQNVDRSWSNYGNYVERLDSYGMQYNYVAVLDFNLPKSQYATKNGVQRTRNPADTSRGGGIFLHVSTGRKTAGCIALAQPVMQEILRWLKPKRNPVILIEVA